MMVGGEEDGQCGIRRGVGRVLTLGAQPGEAQLQENPSVRVLLARPARSSLLHLAVMALAALTLVALAAADAPVQGRDDPPVAPVTV
jgi:hypothetical protein